MDALAVTRSFLKTRLDLDPERIVPEATMHELGVDSLMLLELLFEFEEKMNVTLSRDVPLPTSVAELMAIAEQAQPAAN